MPRNYVKTPGDDKLVSPGNSNTSKENEEKKCHFFDDENISYTSDSKGQLEYDILYDFMRKNEVKNRKLH
jgi:hypothetical protein